MSVKAQKALKAKEKGNNLFKLGKFEESIKLYTEAEVLDSENPIYPSNLSAALFEIGDYSGCVDALLRSWSRLSSENDPALSLKLSTRLAKALSHGSRSGVITVKEVEEHALALRQLEEVSENQPGDRTETKQAWLLWSQIRVELQDHDKLSHEAKYGHSSALVYNIRQREPHLTYFMFGMDEIISLVDDWGPKHIDPIPVKSLSADRLAELSFLIAGVGDGRHALGTLIGLGRAHKNLSSSKQIFLKAHVTLLDIHPAMMARNLLFLMMVDILVKDKLGAVERLEVLATMVYVFIGWIMPSYCEKRLLGVINDLLDRLSEVPSRLPAWLHVDASSVKPVARALEYWANEKNKRTSEVLRNYEYLSPHKMMASVQGKSMNLEGLVDHGAEEARQLEAMLDTLGPEQLEVLGENFGMKGAKISEIKKMVKENKQMIMQSALGAQHDKNPALGLSDEATFYEMAKAFVPPPQLWARHSSIDIMRKVMNNTASTSDLQQIAKDVRTTWKPNITIFDESDAERYPQMSYDAFATVHEVAEFNQRYGISQKDKSLKRDSPTMAYMTAFFEGVVSAVKALSGHLKCEIICGEVNQELSKVQLRSDTRPDEFPRKFTRIWLSNIPDYTHGTLNTCLFVLPALQSTPEAAASSNCLWNSPQWKSDDEFCYNYTMLLSKDLPRYLGIRVIRNEAVMYLLTLGTHPLPRPLNSLASRDDLRAWLTRLLFTIIWPGMSNPRPKLIRIPNNLVAFVCLLVHLHAVGYPGHWLADFLQSVLSNSLVAERKVWNEVLPRPVSDLHASSPPHKTRLDPWQADLEATVATSLQGLPFAVHMPPGLTADARDIGLFSASVQEVESLRFFNLVPMDPVISLIFYKTKRWTKSEVQSSIMMKIPAIIDGREVPAAGTFQILTSQAYVNFLKREVRWRMCKNRVELMRQEGWSMVAWRSDVCADATEPVTADKWVQIASA